MKKILLAMAALTCWGTVSASEAPKMLVDGRSWLWAEFHYHHSEQYAKYYKIDVVGDEVVNGHSCKKLARYYVGQEDEKEYYTAYEKDGRIVWVGEHPAYPELAEYPIMDFNYKKGDYVLGRVEPDGSTNEPQEMDILYRVLDEKTIEVNGTEYRELIIGDMRPDVEDPRVSWVEGIGSSHNRWQTEKPIEASSVRIDYDYLVECSQDGKVIFSRDDFSFKAELPATPKLLSAGKWWVLTQARCDIHAGEGKYGSINSLKYLKAECTGAKEIDGATAWTVSVSNFGGSYLGEDPAAAIREYTLYEKDGLISHDPEGKQPLMNFNAKPGDKFTLWEGNIALEQHLTVTGENTLTAATSVPHRELLIEGSALGEVTSWVEGIGAQSADTWLTRSAPLIAPEHVLATTIDACYSGLNKLFDRNDFSHPITSMPEYNELLADGREWLLEETLTVPLAEDDAAVRKYNVTARLTNSVIDGCKRLELTREGSTEPTYAVDLMEEYGVLYLVDGNRRDILMNFNASNGESIIAKTDDGTLRTTYGVDSRIKKVNGKDVRELILIEHDADNDLPAACWVEGVGSSTPMVLTSYPVPGSGPTSTFRMLECRQDGKVIFTANDFTYPAEASIREITHYETDAAPKFDLQGRRISTPAPARFTSNPAANTSPANPDGPANPGPPTWRARLFSRAGSANMESQKPENQASRRGEGAAELRNPTWRPNALAFGTATRSLIFRHLTQWPKLKHWPSI